MERESQGSQSVIPRLTRANWVSFTRQVRSQAEALGCLQEYDNHLQGNPPPVRPQPNAARGTHEVYSAWGQLRKHLLVAIGDSEAFKDLESRQVELTGQTIQQIFDHLQATGLTTLNREQQKVRASTIVPWNPQTQNLRAYLDGLKEIVITSPEQFVPYQVPGNDPNNAAVQHILLLLTSKKLMTPSMLRVADFMLDGEPGAITFQALCQRFERQLTRLIDENIAKSDPSGIITFTDATQGSAHVSSGPSKKALKNKAFWTARKEKDQSRVRKQHDKPQGKGGKGGKPSHNHYGNNNAQYHPNAFLPPPPPLQCQICFGWGHGALGCPLLLSSKGGKNGHKHGGGKHGNGKGGKYKGKQQQQKGHGYVSNNNINNNIPQQATLAPPAAPPQQYYAPPQQLDNGASSSWQQPGFVHGQWS